MGVLFENSKTKGIQMKPLCPIFYEGVYKQCGIHNCHKMMLKSSLYFEHKTLLSQKI